MPPCAEAGASPRGGDLKGESKLRGPGRLHRWRDTELLSRNHSVESPEQSAEGLVTEQACGSTPASEPITCGWALGTRLWAASSQLSRNHAVVPVCARTAPEFL
jgi:hypothetical protein